ncbi:TonB-dependent receptor [Limibacter armeniacum]|uniref:SusC/RagA family TonB-linked outer membrane protein n=1 Tax=Limibacter armeniacum TaxID=466084 RepID=UPI002FE51C90
MKRQPLLVLLLLLLTAALTHAQNMISVKGTVSDKGTPLPGVSVQLKDTSTGTITDISGKFSLQVPADGQLVFSFIGYISQELAVNGRTEISIELKEDLKQLEEVVVVGYGTQKKSDLTGSVASVKAEDLSAYPVAGATQALQGRMAGVQVQSNNGEPGGSFKVRIRGGSSINASSDPIFVVDGFVGGTLPPPEDIASIEVLKDASATAIYGSRGANGVILVTTKKGKSGQFRISYNTSYSVQKEINRLELLNAKEFAAYINEITPESYDLNSLPYDTDWQEEVLQQGSIQNHQLSVSGGNENVNYYISGVYYDQKGIILNSATKRYSITSNINIKATDHLSFGTNLFARRTNTDGVDTQESGGGTNDAGVITSAMVFSPAQGIYDENGNFTTSEIGDPRDNPYAIATQKLNNKVADRLQGNAFAELALMEGLKFRSSLGVSVDNSRNGIFIPTTLNAGRNVGGEGTISTAKNATVLNENYLSWNHIFMEDHQLSMMAGYSYQSSRNESWLSKGQSFISNSTEFWDLGGASVWQRPESKLAEWTLASFYARANYNYKSRYMLTFNARYDGSSTFSKNNKWGFFPSGAIAWNVGEEEFLKGNELVSQLKLRASYGVTGNTAIGPYQSLARFSPQFAVIGGSTVNAFVPSSVANDNLTWETTGQMDLGVNVGFWDDRLTFEADYYRKVTTDLLFSVPLPEYTGYGTQLKNIGSIENKGLELAINSVNMTGAFEWETGFNISFNRNKVLSLPDGLDIMYESAPGSMVGLGDTQILREGQPVGAFYGWIYDGVYQEGDTFIEGGGFEQEAGGEKYRDISGLDDEGEQTNTPDGQLNNADRTVIGNPNPDFIWGLNNSFKYKGFDLNIFFQGSQGNDILSYTLLELERVSGMTNSTKNALNRWTPTNTDTDFPKASAGRARKVSTRFVYDGSYVRLKNISLGYTLPQNMLQNLKISSVRFYVSAQNIWTSTSYPGVDPEVNYMSSGSANGNLNQGLDYGSYPNAKSYTFGMNVNF